MIDFSEEAIHAIFAPFADPATNTKVKASAQTSVVTMMRNGQERTYVVKSDGACEVRGGRDVRYPSIRSLMASRHFANLRAMAQTQSRILQSIGEASWIPPRIAIDTQAGRELSFESLETEIGAPSQDKVRVVLVDGPAGIGKTNLLERWTYERAKGYARGGEHPPFLYVSSRGRRLSNLNDSLAAATQLVRADFTFEQVPVLVGCGALQLAIDGFDELVDVDGYQDAWYALRGFIEELRGSGLCVLAGRDTFFDQQRFLSRLQDTKTTISLTQLHLEEASQEKAKEWLISQGWTRKQIDDEAANEVLQERSYRLRPFFLTRLAETKQKSWKHVTEERSFRGFLVEEFLTREARLINRMLTCDQADAKKALRRLFEEVAIDLAQRESNEVDVEFLSFLCEYAFEGIVTEDDLRKLQHKVGSLALLEPASSERLRQFPHSEIQFHFLSEAIVRALCDGEVPFVLRRAVLGVDFLEIFSDVLEQYPADMVGMCLNCLSQALYRESSMDRLRNNGTAMLLAAFSIDSSGWEPRVSNAVVDEATILGTANKGLVQGVTIGRFDVRESDVSSIDFVDSEVGILVADSLSRLGSRRPIIQAVHYEAPDGRYMIYRKPADIEAWLTEHSVETQEIDPHNYSFFNYVERLCRRAMRQYYFRPGDSDPGGKLLEHEYWDPAVRILKKHDMLVEKKRSVSGANARLFHVRDARGLVENLNEVPATGFARTVLDEARRMQDEV